MGGHIRERDRERIAEGRGEAQGHPNVSTTRAASAGVRASPTALRRRGKRRRRRSDVGTGVGSEQMQTTMAWATPGKMQTSRCASMSWRRRESLDLAAGEARKRGSRQPSARDFEWGWRSRSKKGRHGGSGARSPSCRLLCCGEGGEGGERVAAVGEVRERSVKLMMSTSYDLVVAML